MTDTISGKFTITPPLTQDELAELITPCLDLVPTHGATLIHPEGTNAISVEQDLRALVRQIGPHRITGHIQVWSHRPGTLYRLGIVDGQLWAYYPQITWPQD